MADRKLRYDIEVDSTAAVRGVQKFDDALEKLDQKQVAVDVDTAGVDKLSGALDSLPGPLGQLDSVLGGGGGVAGGVAAIGVGLFAAADAAADLAIAAKTTADLTGSSVEDASKLQVLWKQTGADVNDLNDVMLQTNSVLKSTPELGKQLGIDPAKSSYQQFIQLADQFADGQIDATQAAALFGEEGVRQMGALRTVYGGLSDDIAAAEPLVSDDDVANAVEMKKAVADVKAEFSRLATEVGQQVVPVVTGLLDTLEQVRDVKAPGGDSLFDTIATSANPITATADALKGFNDNILQTGDDIETRFVPATRDAADASSDAADAYQESADALDIERRALRRGSAAAADVAQVRRDVADAADEQRQAVRKLWSSEDAVLGLMGDQYEATKKLTDARRGAADATFALHDEEQGLRDALAQTAELIQESPNDLYAQQQALDDVARSAVGVADATVRVYEEQVAANGATITAKQKQDAWRASMLQSAETAEGPARTAILTYIATVEGIPAEKITAILTDTDPDDVAQVKRELDALTAPRTATINVAAIGISAFIGAVQGAMRGATAAPTSTSTVVVNQSFPRGLSIDALGEAHKAARRNGRLFSRLGR